MTACGSGTLVESHPVRADATAPVQGTAYYLPKKVLKLQIWGFARQEPVLDANGAKKQDPNGAGELTAPVAPLGERPCERRHDRHRHDAVHVHGHGRPRERRAADLRVVA